MIGLWKGGLRLNWIFKWWHPVRRAGRTQKRETQAPGRANRFDHQACVGLANKGEGGLAG